MKLALTVAMVLGLTTSAFAFDDDWRRRDNGRWRDNDRDRREYDRNRNRGYTRGGNYEGYGNRSGYGNGNVVGRALQNLQSARSRNRVDGHKRNHFERAMYHLQRVNNDLGRGDNRCDHLDDALEHMGDLARADQVHPRDRQMIASDMSALRSPQYGRGQRW